MTEIKIGVVGLGYVGLPLAVEFSKQFVTCGLDLSLERINSLKKFNDNTSEVEKSLLQEAINHNSLLVTNKPNDLSDCNFFIISVPTPIDSYKVPDLEPLLGACKTVGKLLKKGDIVVFESTVYPGATEEECVPILEKYSKLVFNNDFFCGYSPERINPGDKEHTLTNIVKITSGSNNEVAKTVDSVYNKIIKAGTFLVSSIKVAESAKVIENIQRDVNIALVNELAIIFEKIDVSSKEVLEAAGTKWNFLKFKPGLVGGHCIGVDPYYLTHKAKGLGLNPELILAGRRINDSMPLYVASNIIKLMTSKGFDIKRSKILVLGITFKENCPDTRNTKVVELIKELAGYGCTVDVTDPLADKKRVLEAYGIKLLDLTKDDHFNYDLIVKAVDHDSFSSLDLENFEGPTYDITSTLPSSTKQI
tara:strand:+ start:97 stop:1356 length:1260 start_codon:yes stop_codon:yes gene_type:complete